MDTTTDRKKLSKSLFYLMFFIFIVNSLAVKFYWYSSVWYFDMPMHFLGGLWVGLALVYIFSPKQKNFTAFLKILALVLFIGVGWEVFEFIFNNVIAQNSFNVLDTVSDIFFDCAGGTLAVLYYFLRVMSEVVFILD